MTFSISIVIILVVARDTTNKWGLCVGMEQQSKLTTKTYCNYVNSFRALSLVLQFGVITFIAAGAVDLSYHVVSPFQPGSLDAYMGPDGYIAHLALFFGMVLIVIGVISTNPHSGSGE